MTATEALSQALLALADRGRRPPCAERDAPDPCAEDAAERAEAATRCHDCPIFAECAALAVESKATFGVWAGVERTRLPGRPKRGTAA